MHAHAQVCWAFKENLKALLANEKRLHLMENEQNVENVLDVQNAFCHARRISLSECLKQLPELSLEIQRLKRMSMSSTSFHHQALQRPFAEVFLQDAARNVVALQVDVVTFVFPSMHQQDLLYNLSRYPSESLGFSSSKLITSRSRMTRF